MAFAKEVTAFRSRHPAGWWLLLIVASLIVLLLLFDVFGGQLLRAPLERRITGQTGRALSIGALDFRIFSFHPGLTASEVHFANTSWGERPMMLDLQHADISVRVLPLLLGRVKFSNITLAGPTVALERNADGAVNWKLSEREDADQRPRSLPAIERFSIDEGLLAFIDKANGTAIDATIAQGMTGDLPLTIVAKGKALHRPFSAKAQGQGTFALVDQKSPYRLQLEVSSGSARLTFDGSVAGLGADANVDGAFLVAGENIADIQKLIPGEVVLPNTGPYQLKGTMARTGDVWDLRELSGRVGKSDLAGNLKADLTKERPAIVARLRSTLLDLADLGGFIGAKPGEGERAPATPHAATTGNPDRVLPDQSFNLAGLRGMDADVELTAKQVRRPAKIPFENFKGKLVLNNGALAFAPVSFGMAGGDITADVRGAIEAQAIRTKSNVSFRNLQLDKLLPKVKANAQVPGVGRIDGNAQLTGAGRSFAEIVGTLDGKAALFMHGGEMSSLLTEIIGLDAGEAIRFLLGGDRSNPVRCAALGFDAKGGIFTSNVMVFDTEDTSITGNGFVHLGNETMDFKLFPQPKDKSIGSLRVPIRIHGKFADADVSPDKGALALRAGSALLLGMINPLAALIPLIETGGGQDAACEQLLARVKGGAKPPPVKEARPVR